MSTSVFTTGRTQSIQSLSPVSDSSNKKSEEKSTPVLGDFETALKSLLKPDAANQVSEEELFSALMKERIAKMKGEEAAKSYEEALARNIESVRKADGFVPFEQAANQALGEITAAGVLSSEEAKRVLAQTFKASQLDSNTAALYDSRGGENDITIAIDSMESALLKARTMTEKFDSGVEDAGMMDLNYTPSGKTGALSAPTLFTGGSGDPSAVEETNTPSGTVMDGQDGFLFKPVSSNEGTLAVLLPESLAHIVTALELLDSDGNTIESGRSTGYGDLGTREKFSFTKEGKEYPDNLRVVARLEDGTVREFLIPDPSKRYD